MADAKEDLCSHYSFDNHWMTDDINWPVMQRCRRGGAWIVERPLLRKMIS